MKELLLNLNDQVINGEKNALEACVEIKGIIELATRIMKGHQLEAIDEAEKHGKGQQELYGAKIQVKNAAGKWDFDHLDHIVEAKKLLKEEQDQAKDAFKSKEKGIDMIVEGIVIQPADYTPGATTLAITLPKD